MFQQFDLRDRMYHRIQAMRPHIAQIVCAEHAFQQHDPLADAGFA